MEVIKVLTDKIKAMAEAAGDLSALPGNYYEREIVEKVQAGDQIGVSEAVDVVMFLRTVLTSQEASDEGSSNRP